MTDLLESFMYLIVALVVTPIIFWVVMAIVYSFYVIAKSVCAILTLK
jgi:hypothetical protein